MPVQLASFLIPRNGNDWYLLEDKYIKGGFQVVADLTVRDAINPVNRKAGMLTYVQSSASMFQLGTDLVTWTAFSFAQVYNPFYTHKQLLPSASWQIFHGRNCRYFHAQAYESNGKFLIPNDITIIDANTVQLDFLSPISGHCTLSFDQLP
jgi:hypothetical protein